MAIEQGFAVEVSVKGKRTTVAVPDTVQDLGAFASHLAETLDDTPGNFLIINKGRKLDPQEQPHKVLTDAGKQCQLQLPR
jgi:hypothetical protein